MRKYGQWRHGQCSGISDPRYVFHLGPDLWDTNSPTCLGISDNVSGIPLIQTYRTLKDARTWNQWRDALIAKYPAQTEDITAYFAQF